MKNLDIFLIFFRKDNNSKLKKAHIIKDMSLYLGKFYCWRLEIMEQGSGEWKKFSGKQR